MRVMTALNFRIIDGELYTLPDGLENASPQVILKWALDEFGSDVALATGFGAEGCILVDMVARIDPSARIFYLDTDLLFPETYELRDRLEERYGIRFERRSAARSLEQQTLRHGEKLWERDPDLCCRLRKVEPEANALRPARMDHCDSPRSIAGSRAREGCRPGREVRTHQDQSACGLDQATSLEVRARKRSSIQPALRPGLFVDRLHAVHDARADQ